MMMMITKKIIFNYSQLKAARTHNLMKFINDKQNNNKGIKELQKAD